MWTLPSFVRGAKGRITSIKCLMQEPNVILFNSVRLLRQLFYYYLHFIESKWNLSQVWSSAQGHSALSDRAIYLHSLFSLPHSHYLPFPTDLVGFPPHHCIRATIVKVTSDLCIAKFAGQCSVLIYHNLTVASDTVCDCLLELHF